MRNSSYRNLGIIVAALALGCGGVQGQGTTSGTSTASSATPERVQFSRIAAFPDDYMDHTVITDVTYGGTGDGVMASCDDGETDLMLMGGSTAVGACVSRSLADPFLNANVGTTFTVTAVVEESTSASVFTGNGAPFQLHLTAVETGAGQ